MEILLLLLLMIGAAVLYLPEIIKERSLDSPLDTVSNFHREMTALAVSTQNYQEMDGRMYYNVSGSSDPEPYIRRNNYDRDEYEEDDDYVVPYPRNRARAEMETRRQRIMVTLWVVALGTRILTLVPSLIWILPLHVAILVLLGGYSLLVLLLPYYNSRYR